MEKFRKIIIINGNTLESNRTTLDPQQITYLLNLGFKYNNNTLHFKSGKVVVKFIKSEY